MTTTARARRAIGAYGEGLAARHLAADGMQVLDRNWTCAEGEIDLVLREGDVLVVCEVKTRRTDIGGTPHEAITSEKLARLQRLGECWTRDRQLAPPETRVDLVAVLLPRKGAPVIEHVRGIG